MNKDIEHKIANIISETVKDLGFDLVKVTLIGTNANILKILIDRLDGEKVTIGDCQLVSKNVSTLIDIEDIINNKYYLEISSAGIERPLLNFEDYNKFSNRFVTMKLKELLNGQIRYQGRIVKAEDDKICLHIDGKEMIIPFNLIKKASLMLTDEMFRKLLNKES